LTPIALLISLAGLSQREAAAFLEVSPSSIDKMVRGVRSTPEGILAQLRSLIERQERAATQTVQHATELVTVHGDPEFIELGYPADDYEAQQIGWPCVGAWRGMAARVVAVSAWPIRLVPRGTTSGSAAAISQHEKPAG